MEISLALNFVIFFRTQLSEIKYVYLDANNVSTIFKSGFDISILTYFGFGLNFCTLKEGLIQKSKKNLLM